MSNDANRRRSRLIHTIGARLPVAGARLCRPRAAAARGLDRWRAAVLAAVVVGVVLAGCTQRDAQTVRFALAAPPTTLDPRYATDATSYRLCRLIYQALVDFDAAFTAVPALASWEILGATHYRFHLREGQRFHRGGALSAADVLATYRSILDPAAASPHRGSLANVRAVESVSRLVVDFRLRAPDPLFPGLLVAGILPAEDTRTPHDAGWVPNGSGPFALAAPPRDSVIRLERRADGRRFEFVTVRDETVRALKLARGELDIAQDGFSPEQLTWLARQPHVRVAETPGTAFTYLGLNLEDPALRELDVRRALALAIDRDTIIEYIFHSRARPANAILPPDHWAGNGGLHGLPHDPARARRLLAGHGFDHDHRLALTYKTSSDPFRIRLATVLQQQLAAVGIDVRIQSYDWGTFYADVKAGRFQVYSLSWVGLKLPDIFRYAFHSGSTPPAGANRGRYRSARVDAMIAAAEAAGAPDAGAPIYRAIQDVLLDELPYVPLWYENNVVVTRDDVFGYDTNVDGNYDALAQVRRD